MAIEYESFRPDTPELIGSTAERRPLVGDDLDIGGINTGVRDNPKYIAAVDQRTDLEVAANNLSKLYEQLGVDSKSIGIIHEEQTQGTDESPLLSNGAWRTIAAGNITTEVDLSLEDGVKIYERRRSEGNVFFNNNPYTAKKRSL